MRLPNSFARYLCAAVLGALSLLLPLKPALAAEYTDLWVTPGRGRVGRQFRAVGQCHLRHVLHLWPRQQTRVVFGGPQSGRRKQILGHSLLQHGTYFALPWNPGDTLNRPRSAPAISAVHVNNYQGSLIYTVNRRAHGYQADPTTSQLGRHSGWTEPTTAARSANIRPRAARTALAMRLHRHFHIAGDAIGREQHQPEFRLHVRTDVHACRHAVAEWPAVQNRPGNLPVLRPDRHHRRGSRYQADGHGHCRAIEDARSRAS